MPADSPYYKKDFAGLAQDLLTHLREGGGGRTALTDTTEGSVVRTLAEAFARELAVCYGQLDAVYRSGFLDTAEGVALDNVVALLGLTRRRPGHLEGQVTFSRAQPAVEQIAIPASTLLAGRDTPLFTTVEDAAIARGAREVTVTVRSLEPGTETVPAGAISVMPRPLWGVESVTNRLALMPVNLPEDDEGLRARARTALLLSQRGTVAALEEAVRALGISKVLVREPPDRVGVCEVILGDPGLTEERIAEARAAVEEVRPAGIRVLVQGTSEVLVQLNVVIELREDYPDPIRESLRATLAAGIGAYFESLQVGESVRWAKVSALLTAPEQVAEIHPVPRVGVDEVHHLEPYVRSDDGIVGDAANHWVRNGDIRIGPTERARLDLDRLPFNLSLEPPTSEVLLDLICQLAPTAVSTPDLEERLRKVLAPVLETVRPGDALSLTPILEALRPQGVESIEGSLVHLRDGMAVRIPTDAGVLPEALREREVLELGVLALQDGAEPGDGGG